MANIGEQLPQPEAGWKRIDTTHQFITHSMEDNLSANAYNGTSLYIRDKDDFINFNFTGTKLRIFSMRNTWVSKDVSIIIDGTEYLFNAFLNVNTNHYTNLTFEILNLDKGSHKAEINILKGYNNVNNGNGIMIECFDVEEDSDFVLELSRDYEFPMGIIDKAHLEEFSSELINGEEQFLIARDGSTYLTDGAGSYIECNSNNSTVPEVDLTNYYTKTETYNKTEVDALLDSNNGGAIDPNSHTHDNMGIVSQLGETNGILSYKGKLVVNDTEYSYRTLPEFKNPNARGTLDFIKSRGDM